MKIGVILKNIFTVNKPPSQRSGISSDQETEEILIAGRHPDCNIVLMHQENLGCKSLLSDLTPNSIVRKTAVSTVQLQTEESPNSSLPSGEVLPECKTPKSHFPEIENLENRVGSFNIWLRRGKHASALQLQTSRSQRKPKGDGSAKWETLENSGCKSLLSDLTPDLFKKNVESKSTARALFSDKEGMDKVNSTTKKENCTPNSSLLRSKKKPNIELATSSHKEKQTPQILQEMKSARPSKHHSKFKKNIVLKERRPERVPL